MLDNCFSSNTYNSNDYPSIRKQRIDYKFAFSLKRILRTNGPKTHVKFKEDKGLYIKQYTIKIYCIDVKIVKLAIVIVSITLYGV